MDSQRIVDYISGQLRAGHSEARLREHLANHGWQAAAVDAAFERYYHAAMSASADIAPAKRKHRVRISRWTRARFMKLGVASAVLLVAVIVGLHFLWPQAEPPDTEPHALAYKQRQSLDVVLLAGAINSYIAVHKGTPPTALSVTDDGTMVLCGAVCNPDVDAVTPLTGYKPGNVHFMTYASGLSAPNSDVLYVVPGGTCANANELGGENVNPRAMVILYGRAEDSGLVQRCVTL